jgi:hypothetical protein
MDQVKATHNTTSSTKRSYVEIEGDQRTTDALARGMTGNADTEQRDDAKDPQTTKAPKRRTVHRITVDPTDQPSTPIIVQEFPLTYWLDKYNDGINAHSFADSQANCPSYRLSEIVNFYSIFGKMLLLLRHVPKK